MSSHGSKHGRLVAQEHLYIGPPQGGQALDQKQAPVYPEPLFTGPLAGALNGVAFGGFSLFTNWPWGSRSNVADSD